MQVIIPEYPIGYLTAFLIEAIMLLLVVVLMEDSSVLRMSVLRRFVLEGVLASKDFIMG